MATTASPRPAWSVRTAQAEDAAALALVGAATFLDTYAGLLTGADIVEHCGRAHGPDAYAALLDEGCQAWLAEAGQGRAPVGFALLGPVTLPVPDPTPADIELRRIYVLSRFHGFGLGAALMARAIEAGRARRCRRLLLGVHEANARGRSFYARMGFRAVGRRLYRVGSTEHDDLVLALDLA